MHKNVKMWLRALRSGDYAQTQATLCRTDANGQDSFCCLGLYSELHQLDYEFDLLTPGRVHYVYYVYPPAGERKDEILLNQMPDTSWFAQTTGVTRQQAKAITARLAFANDDNRLTFSEIADVVEATYKWLDKHPGTGPQKLDTIMVHKILRIQARRAAR